MNNTVTTKYLGAYNPDNQLWKKIDEIELYKTPNLTIIGSPSIIQGQVSNFSANNYLQFPFSLDFTNATSIDLYCEFTMGDDVTTQQNLLDSYYGIAFVVSNGHLIMSLGSDGSSWDIGTATGTYDIEPNNSYKTKLSWDGTSYVVSFSSDNGKTYPLTDITISSTDIPYATQVYVGGSPALFGAGTTRPFYGTINLNGWKIIRNGEVFWQGMDSAGIDTRANVSLTNLDIIGKAKFNAKQDVISDLDTIRSGATLGATALQNTATGTNSVTVEGTATPNNQATNIGKSSTSGQDGVAVGYNAQAGQDGVAIGSGAIATNGAVQIGTGTNNTANTVQIKDIPVLDNTNTIVSDRIPFATDNAKGGVIIEFDQVNGIVNIRTE